MQLPSHIIGLTKIGDWITILAIKILHCLSSQDVINHVFALRWKQHMIYNVLLPLVLLVTLSRFINPFLSIWFPWYYTVLEVKCWSLEISINLNFDHLLRRSLRCACVYIAAGGWITVHKELDFSLFLILCRQGTKSVSYSFQKFYQQIGLDLAALLFSLCMDKADSMLSCSRLCIYKHFYCRDTTP